MIKRETATVKQNRETPGNYFSPELGANFQAATPKQAEEKAKKEAKKIKN